MNHRTIITMRPDTHEMRMLAWLQRAGRGCVLAVRKWRQARRSRWMLSTFNDRLLADVGLRRHQVGLAERGDRLMQW
jgi:uncharacterized protein YjiS (DUF1127 family)